jgi:hypothetical protein
MTYDAGNPEHVKAARLEAEKRREVWRTILKTREGRAFLYGLIYRTCNLDGGSMGQRGDMTAYNEGARYVGRELKAEALSVDKDSFLTMLRENL